MLASLPPQRVGNGGSLASTAPQSAAEAAQPAVRVQAIPSTSASQVVTPTFQVARSVEGHDTNVVIQQYLDRTFVLVTQTGKIASITQASLPATSSPYVSLASPLGSATDTSSQPDAFLDGGDDIVDARGKKCDPSSSPASGSAASTPLAPPNLTQSPLLGTPTPGFATMQSLYVSTIYSMLRPAQDDGTGQGQQRDPRPVIVALGLRLLATTGKDESDEVEQMATQEGPRFRAIMELVKECQAQKHP